MISIFSRINKELASWIAMFQFLRGLDRYGPNFKLGDEAKAIFDLPPKHCKPRRRNGWHLKNLLLALCCLIAANSEIAALTEQPYEIRARLDAAPGNITVTFDGRIITSLHQFYGPAYFVRNWATMARLASQPRSLVCRFCIEARHARDRVKGWIEV